MEEKEKQYYGFEIESKLHQKIKIKSVMEKISMTEIINSKLWELFKKDK